MNINDMTPEEFIDYKNQRVEKMKVAPRNMTRISVDPSIDVRGWVYAYELNERFAQAFKDEAKRQPPSSYCRGYIESVLKRWDSGELTEEHAAVYIAMSIIKTRKEGTPESKRYKAVFRRLMNAKFVLHGDIDA